MYPSAASRAIAARTSFAGLPVCFARSSADAPLSCTNASKTNDSSVLSPGRPGRAGTWVGFPVVIPCRSTSDLPRTAPVGVRLGPEIRRVCAATHFYHGHHLLDVAVELDVSLHEDVVGDKGYS